MLEIDEIRKITEALNAKCKQLDNDFNAAIEHREIVSKTPIPRDEFYDNICYTIDNGADNYVKSWSKRLQYLATLRGKESVGINKCPDLIRHPSHYNEVNVDAIYYIFGDVIKQKIKNLVYSVEMPEGLNDTEYNQQLTAADLAIDLVAKQREELQLQIEMIGFK